MAKLEPSLRFANNSDVAAILSLLLTSFRSFALFDFLYTPLRKNKDNACDTIFYWSRRLKLAIADPYSSVIVAELSQDSAQSVASWETRQNGNDEAWEMLDWARTKGRLEQAVPAKNLIIIGFAIWRWRDLEKVPPPAVTNPQCVISRVVQNAIIHVELWLRSRIYTRKDQSTTKYAAYLAAEDDLEQRFYGKPCLYLDNLCVDFRLQKNGIGAAMVDWGIVKSSEAELEIKTEAAPDGVPFYTKMGFEKIDDWVVHMPDPDDDMVLAVMQRKHS